MNARPDRASGETARSGRERDFGRFSGRADYLRPHLRHAPWPCALWPQTLGLRNSTRVHCTWFGSAGARRAAVSVRNRATTTPTVCLCFPYVFPLIVFSSSCCCRRYRRVRTFCAEKSAPVSGVPESGVTSSVRRAESSRAGRPRGGPVPGGVQRQCDGPRVLNAAAPGRHATTSPDRRCGKAREAGGRRRSSALGGEGGRAVCIVPIVGRRGGSPAFPPLFAFEIQIDYCARLHFDCGPGFYFSLKRSLAGVAARSRCSTVSARQPSLRTLNQPLAT